MNRKRIVRGVAFAALLVLLAGQAQAAPLGTEFTYQGEVISGGVIAAGPVDLRFRLYDSVVGGVRVDAIGGNGIDRANTTLVNGRFNTTLDFGAAVYAGDARWLEIDVRPAGVGAFTTLVPRQLLSASPYARFAPNAGNAVNAINATNAVNATNATNATNAANALVANNALNLGGNLPAFYTNASNTTSGTLADARLSANVALLNLAQTFSAAKAFTATAAFNNANPFTVGGTNLISNLNADLLDGQTGAFYQNAGNISAGTIGEARLPANVALLNRTPQTFTGHNAFTNNSETSLSSGTGALQIGGNGGSNIGIDTNEIQARNGAGAAAPIFMNFQGGNVTIGGSGASLVGVGTTAPERFFHVFGGSAGVVTSNANSLAVFEDDTSAYISLLTPAASESGILFGTPTNAQEGGIIYGNSGVGNGMQFRTNGNVTRMTLTSLGDLIINDDTSSIQFPATVSPNDAMIHMFASGTANSTRTVIGHSPAFDEWGLTYNDGTDTFIFSQTIGGDPTLAIDMNAGTGGTTGFVGIGTVAPSTKLNIVGGTDASLTAGTGSVQIGLGTSINLAIDSNEVQVRNGAGAAASLFLNAQGGNVFIGSAGTSNVGIGTSAPERFLHVFGGSAGAVTSNASSLAVFEDNTNAYISLLVPAANESGILFGTPTNAEEGGIIYGNGAAGNGLQFRTNGNLTRMTIASNGRIAMGEITAAPEGGLDVSISSAQAITANRNTTDGVLIDLEQDDVTQGSITVTGTTVSYNGFTGSHFAWTDDRTVQRGELVTLTGENKDYHGTPGSEPFFGIKRTSKANDPAVLGAYLGLLEPSKPIDLENPDQIMSVGNGDMWVIDTGTNLEPGDYLISSDLPGCAMKDNPDKFPIGNIVAKSAQRVDWSKVELGADGVRRAKISVLFNQFVRTSSVSLPADQMATLLLQQQQVIQDLEARLRVLEANR